MSQLKPIPPFEGDLRKWAADVVNYLRTLEVFVETPSPKVVQLEFRKPGAKASIDGLLMWDATAGTVVVSLGGAWYPVELGAPL